MSKIEGFEEYALDELDDENREFIIKTIKSKFKNVEAAKRTYVLLRKDYENFLSQNTRDFLEGKGNYGGRHSMDREGR